VKQCLLILFYQQILFFYLKETPMKSAISIISNPSLNPSLNQTLTAFLTPKAVAEVRRFHQSLPLYQPTPLLSLPELAPWDR